jgi:hypothetical protein
MWKMQNCNNILLVSYLLSGFVGAGIALIELATRFSDDVKGIFKNYASYLYIFVNFTASFIVSVLLYTADIRIFNLKICDHPYISSVVIGLLSMGLLRSSFLDIQIGNKTVYTGLPKTINMLLRWVETIYDRNKSSILIRNVTPIVKDIKFDTMYNAIIPTCMAGFTNLESQDAKGINEIMKKLRDKSDSPDNVKVIQLAIQTAKITGFEILKDCVDIYKNSKEELDIDNNRNLEKLSLMKKCIIETKIDLEERKNDK